MRTNQVWLAETVIQECQFYERSDDRRRVPIDLQADVNMGVLRSVSLSAIELGELLIELRRFGAPELHPGEMETIGAVFLQKVPGAKVCSADKAAIESTVLIGLADSLTSLEGALSACGQARNLKRQFTEKALSNIRKDASALRVQRLNP
jgi:hypothetical protein